MGGFLRKLLSDKREGEKKFERDVFKSGYWKWGASTFLKVVDGQVVETGNPIRGKKGQVHFIGIPKLDWFDPKTEPVHVVKTTLSQQVDECAVSVEVALGVFFKTVEAPAYWREDRSTYRTTTFDFQELYDKVVVAGFEHIDSWLERLFVRAAQEDEAVREAFQRYIEHEKPVQFVRELAQALKELDFSGHPLSNIIAIKATPRIDTMRAMVTVEYNHLSP